MFIKIPHRLISNRIARFDLGCLMAQRPTLITFLSTVKMQKNCFHYNLPFQQQQVFKEAIRKFSSVEQAKKIEAGRKYKKGTTETSTNGNASDPTNEPLEKIPLNENGKEEFCITFDKVRISLCSRLIF